jgi:primosomal protein N' (replication factor Y)
LSLVAGRAGRADRPGRVLMQTYMPEHPVMRALVAGDRDAFLAAESRDRQAYGLPPFGRLAGLVVSGRDQRQAEETARALVRAAPRADGVEVLGPAPAPYALLRGRHRFRLLVKARRDINVQGYLAHWLSAVKLPNAVRLKIDIDPYSFM